MKKQSQLLKDLFEYIAGPEKTAELYAVLGPKLKMKDLPDITDEEYNIKLEEMKKEAPAIIAWFGAKADSTPDNSLDDLLNSCQNN